jgi:hypothetical protein
MGIAGNPTHGGTPITGTADSGDTLSLTDTDAFDNASVGDYVQVTISGTTYSRKITSLTANDTVHWLVATPTVSAGDAYSVSQGIATHVYDYAPNTNGLFFTMVRETGDVGYEECPSVKVTGMTFSGGHGAQMQYNFDMQGDDLKWDSAVNDSTTFANVTWPFQGNRILWEHLSAGDGIRINTQGGAALGSGDVITPLSLELSFNRPMSGDYGQGSTYHLINEPGQDDRAVGQLKMLMPRMNSTTYWTEWAANTRKKASMHFQGNLISGGVYRSHKIELPHLKYNKVEGAESQGKMQQPLTFDILAASTLPTGFSTTKPLRLTTVSDYCGDPLQVGN